jgi:hypothetical protein
VRPNRRCGCFYIIETVDIFATSTRNQMAVHVERQVHRFVTGLLLHVGQRRPSLEQQADERMPHRVEPTAPQPALLHDGREHLPHLESSCGVRTSDGNTRSGRVSPRAIQSADCFVPQALRPAIS